MKKNNFYKSRRFLVTLNIMQVVISATAVIATYIISGIIRIPNICMILNIISFISLLILCNGVIRIEKKLPKVSNYIHM